jgi:hypothetical protein
MKINLLKRIELKNTKLKTETKQLDFLNASIEVGYGKSFINKYNVLYEQSGEGILSNDGEIVVSKLNNSTNLLKIITKAPLLTKHPVLALNFSIINPLLKRLGDSLFNIKKNIVKTQLNDSFSYLNRLAKDKNRYKLTGRNFNFHIRNKTHPKNTHENRKKVFIKVGVRQRNIAKTRSLISLNRNKRNLKNLYKINKKVSNEVKVIQRNIIRIKRSTSMRIKSKPNNLRICKLLFVKLYNPFSRRSLLNKIRIIFLAKRPMFRHFCVLVYLGQSCPFF